MGPQDTGTKGPGGGQLRLEDGATGDASLGRKVTFELGLKDQVRIRHLGGDGIGDGEQGHSGREEHWCRLPSVVQGRQGFPLKPPGLG